MGLAIEYKPWPSAQWTRMPVRPLFSHLTGDDLPLAYVAMIPHPVSARELSTAWRGETRWEYRGLRASSRSFKGPIRNCHNLSGM
jgi:hypothetical protein